MSMSINNQYIIGLIVLVFIFWFFLIREHFEVPSCGCNKRYRSSSAICENGGVEVGNTKKCCKEGDFSMPGLAGVCCAGCL